jgi:hypothetical protein
METVKGTVLEMEMGRGGGGRTANNFFQLNHAFVNYYFNIYNYKTTIKLSQYQICVVFIQSCKLNVMK